MESSKIKLSILLILCITGFSLQEEPIPNTNSDTDKTNVPTSSESQTKPSLTNTSSDPKPDSNADGNGSTTSSSETQTPIKINPATGEPIDAPSADQGKNENNASTQNKEEKTNTPKPSTEQSVDSSGSTQTPPSSDDQSNIHSAPIPPVDESANSKTSTDTSNPASSNNSTKPVPVTIDPQNTVSTPKLVDQKIPEKASPGVKKNILDQELPASLGQINVPGLDIKEPESLSKVAAPSQIKQIESSVYEETSEFKSANVIKKSTTLELKKIYEASDEWMTFTVDKDYFHMKHLFHLIVLKGSGTLYIRIEKKDRSRSKTIKVNLDTSYEMTYIPINTLYYLNKQGDQFQLKVERGFLGLLDTPEVKVDLVECVTMEFNQNHRIITKLSEKILYKVVRPDLHVNNENKDDRLQFILQSSLNDQALKGGEEISMYINKKDEFPSQSRYDFMATGNMGYGLIKSLHKGNVNYCIERGCEFHVSIYSKNVDMLFFFPTVFANDSKLKFHRYLYLLEELEGSEVVSYELEVPVHEGDWAFIIQPIEGYPRMYINPDKKPGKLELSKYKSVGEKAEQITITYEQSQHYHFSHKLFYVSFAGGNSDDNVASFKFEVKKIMDHKPKFIKMDYAETGVVANGEIVQYKLQFEVDEPELINFEMNLTGVMGKSMLIIKECEKEGDSCRVTPSDIDQCAREDNMPFSFEQLGDKKKTSKPKKRKRRKKQKVSDFEDEALPFRRRMLQQGYMNGPNMPVPKYQQAQNGYQNQNQYYNPYETDFNSPQNQNNYPQQYTPQNNPQYNNPVNMPPPQQPQQYQPPPQYNNQNYKPPGSTYIPNANYYNQPPPNNGNQGQYYRDMPTNENFNTQDMVNQNDIAQAEWEEQRYMNQQANGFNGTMVPPQREGMKLQSYQLDNNMKPIAPNQQNLTSANAQELERKINDPAFGMKAQQNRMAVKDKELQKIKDYLNINDKQNKINQIDNMGMKNMDEQFKESEQDFQELEPLPDKPKGYDYHLENKLHKDKILCVEAEGKHGERDYRTISMDFNCVGRHNAESGMSFEQLDDKYPYFVQCQFGVGVYGGNIKQPFDGSFYSITGKGGYTHVDVAMKKSKEFIIEESDVKYLRFDLKDHTPSSQAVIQVKVVGITGNCDIYLSKFNKFPSSEDTEETISFKHEHFMSVRTAEKVAYVPFDTYGNYSSLFVGIESQEYCVLDFYVDKLNSKSGGDGLKNEKLQRGKMVKRKLTEDNFSDILSSGKKHVYARSFTFEMENTTHLLSQGTKVTVNSNILGLKLCLQRGNKEYDPEQNCDMSSETGVAIIPNLITLLDPGKEWAVGVLLEIEEGSISHTKLPVEFSLVCSSGEDAKETLEILNPGRVFESHLTKNETIIFKVNLLAVDERSLIILTSEDKSLRGEISLNKRDFSNPKYVLDSDVFAVELDHMEQDIICERMKNEESCIFYIRVSTKSLTVSRFSMTYTVDDIPITLKQGSELFIPNKENMYFLYDPNPLFPAEFNLESDFTQFVVYSKILSLSTIKHEPLESLLTELKYDFKTDIGKEEQLRIPQKLISEAGSDAVVAYLVAPKFDRLEFGGPTIFYKTSSTTRIHVKSKMSKLDGYVEGRATLNKGEFRHFYFNVDNAKDFSLIMTVQSGDADLYLNKGLFNLPTLKSFWKKKTGSKGEEMTITTSSFGSPDEIKGVYTAGIFAKSNCRVAVVYLPSFDNLIKIKPQHLVNMRLRKAQDYYFEFFNKFPVWDLDIFAENSSLKISIMDYSFQKEKDQDLVDMLKDELNYFEHYNFVKGSLPLKHRESNAEVNKHYVVRVRAVDDEAMLNIMLYEPGKPILVPAKKTVSFVGNEKESYIFKTELSGDYEEVKLNVSMTFGNMDFAFSRDLDEIVKAKTHSLKLPVSKSMSYKAPSKPSDIEIFDTFYLKVDTHEFTKFTFRVHGEDKFIEINPFETHIVQTSPKEEQNLYFYISDKKHKNIHNILIDINCVNFFNGQPRFYFNPDGGNEIDLGTESKFLPMPIDDIVDKVSGEFRHIEVRPSVENGYYIITIPKSKHQVPVKISLGINNRRSLATNGVYRYQLPARTDPAQKFSMFLPEKGEFRFLVESCKQVYVNRAELSRYGDSKPIIFQENLVEARKYLLYDDTNSNHLVRKYEMYKSKVFRGVNESPGVLNFVVDKYNMSADEKIGYSPVKKDFMMVTEFKPQNRNLFFKDYLDLWGDDEETNKKKYQYKWNEKKTLLTVGLYIPDFHEQLLIDYPDMKKVAIKFFVYLLSDEGFMEKISLCGIAAVEEVPHVRKEHTEVIQVQTELKSKKVLEFSFGEDDLMQFAKKKKLNIFSYMSVSFYESELEEFEVELESKFANVSYFLLVFNNMYGHQHSNFFLLLIMICVSILIGFVCYLRQQNKIDENDVRRIVNQTAPTDLSQYKNPNEGEGGSDGFVKLGAGGNQIQMSNLGS
jgi:hypothetical protein